MQTDLIRNPGDLITADLWNRVLALIDNLSVRIDAREARVVPDVVGDFFTTALDEISIAQLDLNAAFDVEGTKGVDRDAFKSRIVIAQMPAPEDRVPLGSRLARLVTGPPPKATAGAPTLTQPTAKAQVGQPFDLTGTNFTAPVRLRIRNNELAASQFVVSSATQIHIPSVPDFEGAPTPGTSKDIPITVGNNAGDATTNVTFTAAEIPAARPVVTNIRLIDPNFLRVIGRDRIQANQLTTVTMGSEDRGFQPLGDGSLQISMPTAMSQAFRALPPAVFNLLMALDARDVFLLTISTPIFTDVVATPGGNPQALATARTAGGAPIEFARPVGTFFDTTSLKLFLTMSATLAQQAQNGNPKLTGNTFLLSDFADRPIFSVDITALQDLPITVKVGDKSTTFPVIGRSSSAVMSTEKI